MAFINTLGTILLTGSRWRCSCQAEMSTPRVPNSLLFLLFVVKKQIMIYSFFLFIVKKQIIAWKQFYKFRFRSQRKNDHLSTILNFVFCTLRSKKPTINRLGKILNSAFRCKKLMAVRTQLSDSYFTVKKQLTVSVQL